MIVKDEAHVIARCIASVRPLLSAWSIVDTGSTDHTEAVLRDALAGIPGDLHHRPWVDFATNRTWSLELARDKADYTLIMDADDVLAFAPGVGLPALTHDCYDVLVDQGGVSHLRPHLIRSALPWRYEGVLHEVLKLDRPFTRATWSGVTYRWLGDGARSKDPAKYLRDVEVLQKALEKDPDDRRTWFYLGQSWISAGNPEQALIAHRKRASMGGHAEEQFLSALQVGALLARLGAPEDEVHRAFLSAWELRPTRAEPLVYLAGYYKKLRRWPFVRLYATAACDIVRPPDHLLVDDAAHTWRPWALRASACFFEKRYAEAVHCNERLLALRAHDPQAVAEVRHNLEVCRRHAAEAARPARPR
jgi:glycosyltransferase involved in cell wall biosynthesis